MSAPTELYCMHIIRPTRFGTGDGLDVIDRTTAREVPSGLPLAPGSGVKGALRDTLDGLIDARAWRALFGAAPMPADDLPDHAQGALRPTDARILVLPARALLGPFLWLTCPHVLRDLARGLRHSYGVHLDVPTIRYVDEAIMGDGKRSDVYDPGNLLLVEDLDLSVDETRVASGWSRFIAEALFPDDADPDDADGWREAFRKRFAVVSDEVFDHLCTHCLEVRPRVSLKDGAVEAGPWFEESLPAETVLWGELGLEARPVWQEDDGLSPEALLEALPRELWMQAGAAATIGQGQLIWRSAWGKPA